MDLIGAVVDFHINSDEAEAEALRSLVPAGALVAEFDFTNQTAPYVIVSQPQEAKPLAYGTRGSYRIAEHFVEFSVFVSIDAGRGAAVAIGEAIEDLYCTHQLTTNYKAVLREGTVSSELRIEKETDHWIGLITISFLMEKNRS